MTLEPHPNADSLSLVKVFGFQVVVRTEDWRGRDRGCYIPPDSVVPDTPDFAFLKGRRRVRVAKLRGSYSMGLLVPCGPSTELGTDLAEALGITHYEPPSKGEPGEPGVSRGISSEAGNGPSLVSYKYDVENLRRYYDVIEAGEPVVITEKIHGASGRFTFHEGTMFCGSRNEWKREGVGLPWRTLEQNPWIRTWCVANPSYVLYGEMYGQVQDLRYGTKAGELRFAAFDILYQGTWLERHEIPDRIKGDPINSLWVPLWDEGPFNLDEALAYAERDSCLCPGQMSEGVVVRPVPNRYTHSLGRVQLKIISNRYMTKAD